MVTKTAKVKVVVNPTLAAWDKMAMYKGDRYESGVLLELPEDCLLYRTPHFGSVVPSFVRATSVKSAKPDNGTIVE